MPLLYLGHFSLQSLISRALKSLSHLINKMWSPKWHRNYGGRKGCSTLPYIQVFGLHIIDSEWTINSFHHIRHRRDHIFPISDVLLRVFELHCNCRYARSRFRCKSKHQIRNKGSRTYNIHFIKASGTLFWQITNQTLNVAINFSNANKSNSISGRDLMKSYLLAVSASCSVALGLRSLVPRLKSLSPNTRTILSRLVPFSAVASASALNVVLMRYGEIRDGIDVFPARPAPHDNLTPSDEQRDTRETLGKSRKAAAIAVAETAISRVINCTPIMAMTPLIYYRLQGTKFLRAHPSIAWPVNLALIYFTSIISLPFSLGVFPQRQSISIDRLEERFREAHPRTKTVEFNRGM